MRRVSNEMIWAGIASIVCGVLIASLLAGTGTPWNFVVASALLVLGLVVTTTRRRRHQRVLRAYYEPVHEGVPEQRASLAQEDAPTRHEAPERKTVFGSDPSEQRRAGVRSRSLSTKPSAREPDRLP